jgi:hypothetical protein
MRLAIVLLLSVLLLGFGCLEQNTFPGKSYERVTNTQAVDVDGDGITDYTVYTFAPMTDNESGMTLLRTVTVATETTGAYASLTPALTTEDVLGADNSLDQFSKSSTQAGSDCSRALGLGTVVCSDAPTCAQLCSSASLKCKRIAAVYPEVLAGSMITYVQDMADMNSLLLDARRMVVTLDSGTPGDKNAYLAKIDGIVAKIGEVNANPLFTQPDVALCAHSDYGVSDLLAAAQKIGSYNNTPIGYTYTVLLSAKPLPAQAGGIGTEVSGIGLSDRMPLAVVQKPEDISSIQEIAAVENGSDVYISWNAPAVSTDGYLFAYQFMSTAPPEAALASLRTPTITMKRIDLSALSYTERLFDILSGIVKNYYIALGMALGLTIIVLLLAYNLVLFVVALISERTLAPAFRKAFGKTSVTWKTDAVLAIIAMAAGAYVSIVVATQPATIPTLIQSFDFLIKNGTGMVGLAFVLIGVLLSYFAVENIIKILMLESAYGMVIRHEKDTFLTQTARLKDMLKALETAIDKAREENFDVSQEYETYASITVEKIDALAKSMTVQNKTLVDEYTTRIEGAMKSLDNKKKLADENWAKWSTGITKLLDEQEEVYASSLVDIPVSLRTWALGRYLKEKATEGIVLDHDTLKRKKVTVDHIVREMLEHQVIKGAIVMKDDKVEFAEFSDGSSETVRSVLSLKLRTYMNSLARNIGQKEPVSLLVVGSSIAMVYLHERNRDGFLFVGKDKFAQAVEQWKAKTKMLE